MILHENEKDFIDAVSVAAEGLGIREVYIEKDYWVTYVLKRLSQSIFIDKVVFKGGTSLSKAYHLIERFSEDVDLALLLDGNESDGKIKKLIKEIEGSLMMIPFISNKKHVATSKGSKFRKTAHQYPRLVNSDNFGYALDHLILEINSFANPTPYRKMAISYMIGDFFQSKNEEIIEEYELHKVEINVLDIRRTFTEKIMALIRAGHSDNPIDSLRKRIRHIYDLHQMMTLSEIRDLLENNFSIMLSAVRDDDQKNIQFQGPWMDKKLAESYLFKNPKEGVGQLGSYYNNTFSSLVYGSLPTTHDIIETVEKISAELVKVEF